MKRRLIKMLALMWMIWFLSWPVVERVDFWDGPAQDAGDIFFHAGGGLTLIAAAFCLVIRLAKKVRERYLCPAKALLEQVVPPVFRPPVLLPATTYTVSHSPPAPFSLRI